MSEKMEALSTRILFSTWNPLSEWFVLEELKTFLCFDRAPSLNLQ